MPDPNNSLKLNYLLIHTSGTAAVTTALIELHERRALGTHNLWPRILPGDWWYATADNTEEEFKSYASLWDIFHAFREQLTQYVKVQIYLIK